MSFNRVPSGYTLIKKTATSELLASTNLANKAQALYEAKKQSLKFPDATFNGYRQGERDALILEFKVQGGEELPLAPAFQAMLWAITENPDGGLLSNSFFSMEEAEAWAAEFGHETVTICSPC